jgi:cytochrome P450
MVVSTAPGRLPVLGHALSLIRKRTEFTGALRRYGTVVRIFLGSVPTYVVTDPELIRRVLVTDAARYERGIIFDRIRPFLGNGLATSSGRRHLRDRRMLQPAFHQREIAGYVAGMARIAQDMVSSWRPGETRVVDEDMQVLAGTVVGDALFSTSLTSEDLAAVLDSIQVLIGQSTIRAMAPSVLSRLPLAMNRRYDEANARVRGVVAKVVAARRAGPEEHRDLLHMLLAAQYEDTGAGMTDEEIHDQVLTLFLAGAETTARALAWFFHELARRPEIQERVVAELADVLAGEPVGVNHLPRVVYTRQVFDEVLRHYAVWLLMRRSTTDVDLGDVRLPTGSEIIISPHALHHDPKYFPDPDRFDPDRWSPERASEVPRGAYLPFAAGAHLCIGNTFALTEMVVVAATVLSRVCLTPAPGKPMRAKVTNLPVPSGLRMTVTPT